MPMNAPMIVKTTGMSMRPVDKLIMGQSSNKAVRSYPNEEFKCLRKYSNACYGELTLIEEKATSHKFALKEIVSDSLDILKVLEKRKSHNHPNLIRLLDYSVKDHTSICSSLYQIILLLQYEEMTLEEEIIERQSKQNHFTARQLRTLTQTAVSALSYLVRSQSNFRVAVENILITEDCEVRIVDPTIFAEGSAGTETTLARGYFVCDESEVIGQYSKDDEANKERFRMMNSVFYLGIVLLSCCRLNENLEADIITNGEYNFSRLKKISKEASKRYPKMGPLIQRMIKKNPYKRPSHNDILLELTPKLQRSEKAGEVSDRALGVKEKGPHLWHLDEQSYDAN